MCSEKAKTAYSVRCAETIVQRLGAVTPSMLCYRVLWGFITVPQRANCPHHGEPTRVFVFFVATRGGMGFPLRRQIQRCVLSV